jgi:hypothetical protein
MKKVTLKLITVLFLITFLMEFATVYAQGGGQSTSPGIPGQKPLNLSSITLTDGSSIDVPGGITTKPKFKITFDKNVVNMLYWENNAKCFSIVSASKQIVPVIVTKIDDTVDFSQRQNIFLQPASELKPGTSYYINISPELTAKNGIKLGASTSDKGLMISFKTKGQAPSAVKTPSKVTVPSTKKPVTSAVPKVTKPAKITAPTPSVIKKSTAETNKVTKPAAPNVVQEMRKANNYKLLIIILILILAIASWIAANRIMRKRKNRKD